MKTYLQKEVYMQTLWFVRRYWDMLEEREDIMESSPDHSGGGSRGNSISNPTAYTAEKIEKLSDDIRIIEKSLEIVPEGYRYGILLSIIAREKFPDNANFKTYNKWKRRFLYAVAIAKGFIY